MGRAVEPYRLLFVCTANICRSPTAEALARHRYGEKAGALRSAGFLEGGRSCPEPLLEVLAQRGIDASRHRSYQLDQASLDAAHLVLTMEGDHVQQATLIDPTSFPRVMPLKEAAAHMADGTGPMPIEELVEAVNDGRDPTTYLSTRWDVDDPYGKRSRDYRRAVEEIDALVEVVIGLLV